MKLNKECAYDILKKLETYKCNSAISFIELNNSLSEYSDKPLTVQYTCLKLEEAGFITIQKHLNRSDNSYSVDFITGLTYAGHSFLEQLNEKSDNHNSNKNNPANKRRAKSSDIIKIIAEIIGIIASVASIVGVLHSCSYEKNQNIESKIESYYTQTDTRYR